MADISKILVLVTREMDERQIEAVSSDIQAALMKFSPRTYIMTDSAAWYREKFASSGSWESWIFETVAGRDYHTRRPNFDGFVVATTTMGKANASICSLALQNDRAVLAWQEDQPLRLVTSINLDNPDDWANGWSFESKAIGGAA